MTTGEYSYLLLRKMQTYVSCGSDTLRAYLYNFFGEVFNDPSVVIDEQSYQNFVKHIDEEMDYCAKRNLNTAEEVYEDERFGTMQTIFQRAFAEIGIDVYFTYGDDYNYPTSVVFILPSGRKLELLDLYEYLGTEEYFANYVSFRSRMRVTDEYFNQMQSYYYLDHEPKHDLRKMETHIAGDGTVWKYNPVHKVLEIGGRGYLVGKQLWENMGIEPDTIIIGAGVTTLCSDSIGFSVTMVDMHGAKDHLQLDAGWCGSTTTARLLVIYTDNEILRNYEFADNIAVQFYALSEWEGI